MEEGRQANFRLFDKPLYSTKVPLKICCIYFRSFDAKGLERVKIYYNLVIPEHSKKF